MSTWCLADRALEALEALSKPEPRNAKPDSPYREPRPRAWSAWGPLPGYAGGTP